ncbi:MAG TPA: NUDIX hydrolase [Clostridiales bacterium]|nr:NUDIX hydrolase [Clostridiales bacterium]
MKYKWLDVAKKIQAIAQSGLAYTTNKYDAERYEELRKISIEIVSDFTGMEMERVEELFANETGYQTPKVDVRAVVFKDNKILLVKEKVDGCWALPGGWADIGLSPGQVAMKETYEEAGLEVKPVRLLAVLDNKNHYRVPFPYHIYKIFILCKIVSGRLAGGMETSDADFFAEDGLPKLSQGRNTVKQIKMMFDLFKNPTKQAVFE